MTRAKRNTLFWIINLLTFTGLFGQDFIKIKNDSRSLSESMRLAFDKGKSQKNFWIGYSIIKNEENRVTIGSFYTDDYFGTSLRDLIMNSVYNNSASNRVSSNNSKRNVRIIHGRIIGNDAPDKEVAILFRYDGDSRDPDDFAEISVFNLSSYIDLEDYTVFWLGNRELKESVNTLVNIYKASKSAFAKKELVAPIGIHSDENEVIKFLESVYNSDEKDELREEAVFWLGFQNNPGVLELLKNIIIEETSQDIKEKAVMALGQLKFEEATDELIKIAKTNHDNELREAAVMWLGQKAVKKAENALKDFIENDPDIEIKKRAVYALANNSDKNVPYLIELANSNKSLQIRKHAIWALGNSDDKRSLEALIKLVKK